MTTALYAGSFDPVTNGHVDIATRASRLFDKVYVGVFATPAKNLTFTTEERVALAADAVAHLGNVEVVTYSNLTVEFARSINATVLVRGLRMVGDFEWEIQVAMVNKKMAQEIESVCFMASQEYQFLSSRMIREVAALGGDVSCFVPRNVAEALKRKGFAIP